MVEIKLSPVHAAGTELKYLQSAIDRGEISNFGENLELFREKVETYFTKPSRIVFLNSGTSAIHLALTDLGIERNDEVICQSFTFAASAFPILYQNAKPIFIDSEMDTWNMCPFYLEELVKARLKKGKKPKAIIVVHSYGMPAKMQEILSIGKNYEIPVIEDAAEALGSKYDGTKCGALGNYGIISFNGNKMITTSGGGALICPTSKTKDVLLNRANQSKNHKPYYEHSSIGFNYSISNIAASIGCAQIDVLEERIKKRRVINKFYEKLFKNIDGITLLKEPNTYFFSNHWVSCILIESKVAGFTALELQNKFAKNQIESRYVWKPMHLQSIFKNEMFYGDGTSEKLFHNCLCLPSGSTLSNEDLDRIAEVIKSMQS